MNLWLSEGKISFFFLKKQVHRIVIYLAKESPGIRGHGLLVSVLNCVSKSSASLSDVIVPKSKGADYFMLGVCMLSSFSYVWLFDTLWIAAHQAPLSTGFSRQEY